MAEQFSKTKRRRIYERDGHRCIFCGAIDDLTLDHALPRSRGGGNEDLNLGTCCRRCNAQKGNKTIFEFVAWRLETARSAEIAP